MTNLYDIWKTTDESLGTPIAPEHLFCSYCGHEHYDKFITIDNSINDLMCFNCILKNIFNLIGVNSFDRIDIVDKYIYPTMSLHSATYYDNNDITIYEKLWTYFYIDSDYKVKYYCSPINYYKHDGSGNKINQKLNFQKLSDDNIIASVCHIKKKFNDTIVNDNHYLKINFSFELEL